MTFEMEVVSWTQQSNPQDFLFRFFAFSRLQVSWHAIRRSERTLTVSYHFFRIVRSKQDGIVRLQPHVLLQWRYERLPAPQHLACNIFQNQVVHRLVYNYYFFIISKAIFKLFFFFIIIIKNQKQTKRKHVGVALPSPTCNFDPHSTG